jgi:2,3-diketo-5-methylthio-1-phosphopentane phosphatase
MRAKHSTKGRVPMPDAVLVSDFDGTMTAADFYKLVAERLLPPGALAPWEAYRAGRITHFAALQTIFGSIRAPQEQLLDAVRGMRPDQNLAVSVAKLRAAGWEVVVASAGCDWYIRRLLAGIGLTVELHANPGVYRPDGALLMEAPTDSPFYCPEFGIDKAAVVRFHLGRGLPVAFAGDGFADLSASLLVHAELRFARADLAKALREQGKPFRPFAVWSDIARTLLFEARQS